MDSRAKKGFLKALYNYSAYHTIHGTFFVEPWNTDTYIKSLYLIWPGSTRETCVYQRRHDKENYVVLCMKIFRMYMRMYVHLISIKSNVVTFNTQESWPWSANCCVCLCQRNIWLFYIIFTERAILRICSYRWISKSYSAVLIATKLQQTIRIDLFDGLHWTFFCEWFPFG